MGRDKQAPKRKTGGRGPATEQKIERVPIASVTPHPRNPRRGDVDAIQDSIKHNGWYGAIVVQRSTGHVIAGNHRLLAAQRSGMTEVDAILIDVDDEHALRILLADNRTNDRAGYDKTALAELLRETFDTVGSIDGTGYNEQDLSDLLRYAGLMGGGTDDPEAKTDKAEALREKWATAPGDLWEIPSKDGKRTHRLLCGDATNADDVARLMGVGGAPSLMVTDCPRGVENDDEADCRVALALFTGDVLYAWSPPGEPIIQTGQAILDSGFEIRNQIIWAKPHRPISRAAYADQHEPCWYAVRKGQQIRWVGPANESTKWDITLDKDAEGGHSTQKPLECMQRPIRNHRGDVYDPFVGRGTTIVAAENECRASYAMEIDPACVAVCLERVSAMGLKPRRVTNPKKRRAKSTPKGVPRETAQVIP